MKDTCPMNHDHELDKDKHDNVVSFPFGGLQRSSVSSPASELNDPIEELLNEFSDWEIDEEEWEPSFSLTEQEISEMYSLGTDQPSCEMELLNCQIDLLEDVTKRMKFYLDEVELFTQFIKDR